MSSRSAHPRPWEDEASLLDDLDADLAGFASRHLTRLCCLEVIHLLGRGHRRFTEADLARSCGWSQGQARRALELLWQSGLLHKSRGPCYTLTPDPNTQTSLNSLVDSQDRHRPVRLAVLAFVLAREVKALQEELETRRLVERAKGLLMKRQGLAEEQAQQYLLKLSRDRRQSLRSTANKVLAELGENDRSNSS